MKKPLIGLLFISLCALLFAQQVYTIDASQVSSQVKSGHLKMGNSGAAGNEILVNNRYMTVGGKPIIPVMGEMHYSRIPKAQWEDVILKMKAGGINIIACYILWIHHEEIEGQYDWSDNKDLRAFAKLCAKHGMWVYPRIGPWCHAEVRNGALPDWILQKANLKDRSNDPVYQAYVDKWFKQIGLQLKGLMYKDGGSVIGTQLENEYGRGKGGEDHILWLKKTALKYGIDVPMYTVTGWQSGSVPPYEVIPLWGAYPDAPWADNLNRKTDCNDFRFTKFRDNENIGNGLKKQTESYIDFPAYPYFTCEVGVGIENTDHRRLKIGSLDGLGLITTKIGSGSNLPGYYMFAGGSNPRGILTSMEENRDETGYWNTNPVISYDFQAAIRESGELNKCYFEVKKLHYLLNEFGGVLAPMEPVFSAKTEDLQYVVRTDNNSAFLFGINYCRHNVTGGKKNVQFNVQLKNETIVFPSKPTTIADSSTFVWPINFSVQNVLLKYATAQPLCNINNKWIFIQDANSAPEFCFDGATIDKLESTNGKVLQKDGRYIITNLQPGMNCIISILPKTGSEQKIVLLSKEEAQQAWLLKSGSNKFFFVSDANMYMNGTRLHLFGTSDKAKVSMLNPTQGDVFTNNTYQFPAKQIDIAIKELKPLDDAQWLKISAVANLNNNNTLMHRFFVKEFNLGNTSKIKKASLIIAPQAACKLQLNNSWVNQSIVSDSMNVLDVTGYVNKNENSLMLDFPFEDGQKSFAAKLVVEYFNADKIELSTDQSWIMKDSYTYPSYLIKGGDYKQPEIVISVEKMNKPLKDFGTYTFALPDNYLANINNLYLRINYTGNKARLYYNHQLVADDFYNGDVWHIGLNKLGNTLENQSLKLEITPLKTSDRVYFDDEAAKAAALKAAVKSIFVLPEYNLDFDVIDNTLKQIKE